MKPGIIVWSTCVLLIACGGQKAVPVEAPPEDITDPTEGPFPPPAENDDVATATADLFPTVGNDVHGKVEFIMKDGKMRVIATVEGLTPGKHGFHIHEYGDCSAEDGTSAGGHFNPEGVAHGSPTSEPHHVGDLGNLDADADGNAVLDFVDPMLTFEGEHDILNRAIIVHAGEDDFVSQPTGAAGPRVACGVIKEN